MAERPHKLWPRLLWIAAGGYALVLANFLLAPHPWWFLGSTGETIDQTLSREVEDYLQHAGVFIPLALLTGLAQALTRRPPRAACIAATIAYAFAGEGLQYFIPNRYADLTDALANFGGVVVGWLLVLAVTRPKTARR